MRTWYKHQFGKLDRQDIQFVKVFAEFEKHEEEYALACGWAEISDNVWQQLRTVRIDIEQFCKHSKQPKTSDTVDIKCISGAEAKDIMPTLAKIYQKYLDHHGYTLLEPNPIEDISDTEVVYLYSHQNNIVGFSIWTMYGLSLDNWQMAWDYVTPKLQLGKYSLWYEMQQAHNQEKLYFYLGASYDKSCRWKSTLHGFEWWDGEAWQKDADAYNRAIDMDENLIIKTPIDNII